ncbi:MAG TPA: methylenetetrahydrofolate reductase [Spirochaetia bacterium]|nr:methylenetetrahydrofolate reductase [Spirochaetia bacterium]
MKCGSTLERTLQAGHFAVTAELGPPRGTDIAAVEKKAGQLRGAVDAVNVTDNQSAMVHMSSMACATLLLRQGVEPVMQMTCRDRNRIAIQSDILGASALGIRNILCISGDHHSFGDQPGAKKVYDIDSTQLVALARRLRDERRILASQDEVCGEVPLFIGTAANPFASPLELRAQLLAKKVAAGADFAQTQCVFDIGMFADWMEKVRSLGAHTKCRILAGIIPLKSLRMARYMVENVPGIMIPDSILKRMEAAPKEKAAAEGIRICCEIIRQVKEIEGVAGIHIMAIEWEHRVPDIVEKAGLLPRPA